MEQAHAIVMEQAHAVAKVVAHIKATNEVALRAFFGISISHENGGLSKEDLETQAFSWTKLRLQTSVVSSIRKQHANTPGMKVSGVYVKSLWFRCGKKSSCDPGVDQLHHSIDMTRPDDRHKPTDRSQIFSPLSSKELRLKWQLSADA